MSEHKASLTIDGKSIDLTARAGTMGPSVLDIRNLYGETEMFTFDPGFTSTASCESKITFIDGDAGVLLYRGYPIDQLAEHGDFLETCYLLLYGELPSAAEKANFDYRITRHTMVHEQMARFFKGSVATHIPWRSWWRQLARCRRFITTQPILLILSSAWSPPRA